MPAQDAVNALEKYNIIRKSTIDFYIQQTVQTPTEFDIASVLFNLYKDSFEGIYRNYHGNIAIKSSGGPLHSQGQKY